MPRNVWKMGRNESLGNGVDGKVQATEVYLPDGQLITREINHLYPLKITAKLKEVKIVKVLYSMLATLKKPMRDLQSDELPLLQDNGESNLKEKCLDCFVHNIFVT